MAKIFHRFVHWIGVDLGVTPNQITVGRLFFFVPGWSMFAFQRQIAAWTGVPWQVVGFLGLITVTTVILFDIVDGALARATGQVSDQGKILDPAVDKFITYSTLALFWSAIDKVALGILFALDIMSTFLRSVNVQGANEFGKRKALSQNLSKLFFGLAVLLAIPQLNRVGNLLVWVAVFLASISVGIRIIPSQLKSSFLVLIPQLLTFCNLLCGSLAVWCAITGQLKFGVLFCFAAMGFDLADGAVARKLGVSSTFGKHFDTVADLASFGIAPAAMVAGAANWTPISMICGGLYIMATALRLYEYERTKDKTPQGFFRGLPSPAAAWLVVSVLLWVPPLLRLAVMVAAAILMCLFKVHWPHFSRILPTVTGLELSASLMLGLLAALTVNPVGILVGPVIVYVLSPKWRKPQVE